MQATNNLHLFNILGSIGLSRMWEELDNDFIGKAEGIIRAIDWKGKSYSDKDEIEAVISLIIDGHGGHSRQFKYEILTTQHSHVVAISYLT